MKLTTIMHLHESVNQKSLWARHSVFWLNLYEFLDYIKNRHIYHALPCIVSLVDFLYKLDHIFGKTFLEKLTKIGAKWLLWQLLKVFKMRTKTVVFKKLTWVMCLWYLSFDVKLGAQIEGRQRLCLMKMDRSNAFLLLFLTFFTPL